MDTHQQRERQRIRAEIETMVSSARLSCQQTTAHIRSSRHQIARSVRLLRATSRCKDDDRD